MKLFPRIFLVAVTITGLGIFTTLFIGSADYRQAFVISALRPPGSPTKRFRRALHPKEARQFSVGDTHEK
jgi:hypothetical protein